MSIFTLHLLVFQCPVESKNSCRDKFNEKLHFSYKTLFCGFYLFFSFEMLTVGKPGKLNEAETRQQSIMFFVFVFHTIDSLMWTLHVSPIPGIHFSSGAG